ncbi:MAG: class I SAM-dependent methyltransferase [Planctomycetota bacterium]|nr:class I SAM-dependent methyltransferase [Planctomycetota bacterium]
MMRLLVYVLSILRWFVAPFVLIALGVYWLFLVVVFAPLIAFDAVFGWTRSRYANEPPAWAAIERSSTDVFDRHADVSKLTGCNTRNVRYRWTIFDHALKRIEERRKPIRALDFGAGSLRDSFEMARRGYRVTAVDLNRETMRRHASAYEWNGTAGEPELIAGSLDDLGNRRFEVITAFDVIEHLEDLEQIIERLSSHLVAGGVLLVTVPNRRSFYERHNRIQIAMMRQIGIQWIPGEPHLNFRTPSEWRKTFERHGFTIGDHDMALGFLVNDACHTAFRIPLLWIVCPVLDRILSPFRGPLDRESFIRHFFPRWLVERIDLVDRMTKPLLHGMFGWNLFVLERVSGHGPFPTSGACHGPESCT